MLPGLAPPQRKTAAACGLALSRTSVGPAISSIVEIGGHQSSSAMASQDRVVEQDLYARQTQLEDQHRSKCPEMR